LPLGHHLTPPNVPNVCYRPNNIMVKDPPSSSSNPYPPIPPDVVQILGTWWGLARTDDDLRRLLDALDPVLGGADDVWAALLPKQQTELCRHVKMRTVRDNDGDKVDEYNLGDVSQGKAGSEPAICSSSSTGGRPSTPRAGGVRSSCASAGPAVRKLPCSRRPGWVGGTLANSLSGRGGIGTTVDRPRQRRRGSIVSQPGGTTTAKTLPP
jgi:hypothetical protein